jgi:glycosyltransferase involved in cell wall biosynthesis
LRSIREQSYANIEHIVRDGGSTDGTLELLRASDVRWSSQQDRGQTHALNLGLAETSGEIIGWVNSDDFLSARAVETAVGVLEESGADLVYGRCLLVDAEGREIGLYRTEMFSYARLLERNIIAQPAVFFHRRVYERFGPLNERLSFAMDYEYWLRCGRNASFRFVPEVLAAYRIHAAAKTSTGAMKHAAEANSLRMHYGRGHAPMWRLRLACLRTTIGGFAKSSPIGFRLLRYLSWQRSAR